MCGIYGYIGKNPSIEILKKIALLTSYRGPHACGFATINKEGKTSINKRLGKLEDNIDILNINGYIGIGHNRLSTTGNINLSEAQPIKINDVIIAHNGILSNLKELVYKYKIKLNTSSDTEALLISFLKLGNIEKLIQEIKDNFVIIIYKYNHLYIVTKNLPLYTYYEGNTLYFSSRKLKEFNFIKIKDLNILNININLK